MESILASAITQKQEENDALHDRNENSLVPRDKAIKTYATSISWLWYCTTVKQDVTTWGHDEGYMESICIISYDFMWIYHVSK